MSSAPMRPSAGRSAFVARRITASFVAISYTFRVVRQFPVLIAAAAVALSAAASAQRQDAFVASRNHPAIAYDTSPVTDRVGALNRRIQAGEVQLTFDPASGYL